MVRQWQELFYDERYSQVYLSYDVPDYVKLAEAYGCVGLRAEHPDEVDAVIEKALSVDRPQRRDRLPRGLQGDVLPDGPAGASNDDIILGPEGLKPVERSRGGTGRMSTSTRSPCWSRTSPASSRAWPGCSPRAGSTSTRSRSARPTTPGCRG